MDALDNPQLRQQLQTYLSQQQDALSWVETHGLLCAIAAGPVPMVGWQDAIFLEDDQQLPADIAQLLEKLAERIASDLGAGDAVTLPCRLDPYEDKEGQDLVSWCTGFMAGVFASETLWYAGDEEKIANLLLPFLLISGLEESDELDELWDNTQLVRQMALGLPSLLEELFLYFHAPELPEGDADEVEED